MSDFNNSSLSGRLTRDAELKYTTSGSPVLDFSLASNQKRGDKEETMFLDCTMFGDRAEKLVKHLQKGKSLIVSGKLRQESWEKDGDKRSKISLLVDSVTFLSSPNPSPKKD